MNKQELIEIIAEKTGWTKKDCGILVNMVFDEITEKIANDEDVRLSGFGNFISKKVPERTILSPIDHSPLTLGSKRKVLFRPGEVLKEKISK